jgi:hypothetical protein
MPRCLWDVSLEEVQQGIDVFLAKHMAQGAAAPSGDPQFSMPGT